MKLISILGLFTATAASAATIQFSNFQSSAVLTMPGSGVFGGWDLTERAGAGGPYDVYTPWNPVLPAGAIRAFLTTGRNSWLMVEAEEQRIRATASVDWSAPGYVLTRVDVGGRIVDDGNLSRESMSARTGDCGAGVPGNASFSFGACAPSAAMSSGTLTADLYMTTDASTYWKGMLSGTAGPMFITLTLAPAAIHNPEPGTLLLIGCGLVGLALIRRRKNG